MKELKSYKHLLLDFDGTICDLIVDWQSMKKELLSTLPEQFIVGKTRLPDIINSIYQKGSASACDEMHLIIRKYEQPQGVVHFKNVNSLLLQNSSSFIVVSNNLRSTILNAFDEIKPLGDCLKIIGVDDVKNTKPSITPFEQVLTFTGNPDLADYLFIGDSQIDEQFAFNCGMDFLHISNYENTLKKNEENEL